VDRTIRMMTVTVINMFRSIRMVEVANMTSHMRVTLSMLRPICVVGVPYMSGHVYVLVVSSAMEIGFSLSSVVPISVFGAISMMEMTYMSSSM